MALLNYSIWTLCISTFYGFLKPMYFTPAFSMGHIGILSNFGSFYSTFILGTFLITLIGITMGSLSAAMIFRYLMVFPSKLKKLYTFKTAIIFVFSAIFLTIGLLIAGIISLQNISTEEIFRQIQAEDEAFLIKLFITDKTLFIMPYKIYGNLLKITLAFLILAHFGAFAILAFFCFQMHKYSNIIKNISNYNIIISILVQGFISFAFLISPYTFVFGFFVFEISNSATISTLLNCLFCSHCFVDFISTLYFVTPYRNFIALEILKLQLNKNVTIAPAVSTTVMFK